MHGGTQTLDYIDFIDLKIYNLLDQRNLKHIYKNKLLLLNNNYDQDSDFILYYFNDAYLINYNTKYLLNKLNFDIYNIAVDKLLKIWW